MSFLLDHSMSNEHSQTVFAYNIWKKSDKSQRMVPVCLSWQDTLPLMFNLIYLGGSSRDLELNQDQISIPVLQYLHAYVPSRLEEENTTASKLLF